jgi:hypothetical protein
VGRQFSRLRQRSHELLELVGIGPRFEHAVGRLLQSRGGHQLHGFRDLLDVLRGFDSLSDLL